MKLFIYWIPLNQCFFHLQVTGLKLWNEDLRLIPLKSIKVMTLIVTCILGMMEVTGHAASEEGLFVGIIFKIYLLGWLWIQDLSRFCQTPLAWVLENSPKMTTSPRPLCWIRFWGSSPIRWMLGKVLFIFFNGIITYNWADGASKTPIFV